MKHYISYKEAKELEEKYKNQGDITDEKGHKIILGKNSKIMISCPHSVSQLRGGKIKIRESYIGVISQIIQKNTNCHLIIKTRNMSDDANYDKNSNYKDELEKYIKDNNIKLLIDLHGLFSHKFDIELGTYYGNNLSDKKIIKTIYNNFIDNDINSILLDKIMTSGAGSISYDMRKKTNINTLQLEISKKYRWPKTRIDAFNKIIGVLIDLINKLDNKDIETDFEKNYNFDFDKILNIDYIEYDYKPNLVGIEMSLGINYNIHDKMYIETLLSKLKNIISDKGYFKRVSGVISDYSFSIVLKPINKTDLLEIYFKILKIIRNSKETIIYKTSYNSSLNLRFAKKDIIKYHKDLINYLHKNKNMFFKNKYNKVFEKSTYEIHLKKQKIYTGKYAIVNYLNKNYFELRGLKIAIKLDELENLINNVLNILEVKNE